MTRLTKVTDRGGSRVTRWAGYDGCIELSNSSTRVVLDPNVGGRVLSYALNGIESLWQEPSMNGVVWDGGSNITQPSAGRFDIGPEYGGLERSQLWLGRWRAEITGERSARMTSPACPAGVPPSSAAAEVGIGSGVSAADAEVKSRSVFAAPGDGRTPAGVQLIRDFVLAPATTPL